VDCTDVSESEEEIDSRRRSKKYFYGKDNEAKWKKDEPLIMFALEP
jgi:hypothetical protein